MTEVDAKCPNCGHGFMKLTLNTTQFPQAGLSPHGRVRCTICGFEDTALRRNE